MYVERRFTGGIPKRWVAETVEWVQEQQSDASGLPRYLPLRAPDVTEQPSPIRIDSSDPDRYSWNRPWQNYGTFVLEARDLRFESRTCSFLTEDHTLLYDLSRQWPDRPAEHALLKCLRLPQAKRLSGRTLLLSVRAGGENYFNWLTMVLPRLRLIEVAGYRIGDFDHIVVNNLLRAYQRETLACFGVDPARVVTSDGSGQLRMDDVVAPSLPYQAGFVRRWAIDYLQSILLGKPRHGSCERVDLLYISRSDAKKRRVINEEELMARLEPMGFKRVSFSGMSVNDQARVMSRARCVVAPHGAGLTNLVFAPAGIDVVELHACDYYSSSFWWISTRMGHRHAVIFSESPIIDQGIQVDIKKLTAHLRVVFEDEPKLSAVP